MSPTTLILSMLALLPSTLTQSTTPKPPEYKSLNSWHDSSLAIFSDDRDTELIEGNCVKDKIRLTHNGEKRLERKFALTVLSLAKHLCTEGIEELWEVGIMFLASTVDDYFEDKLGCFQRELKRIEPEATIVKNFDVSAMTVDSAVCEEALGSERFGKFIDAILSDMTISIDACDAIKSDDVKTFAYRMPIIKFGNDPGNDGEVAVTARVMHALQGKVLECFVRTVDEM